jgi:hypothetical protein
MQKKSDSDIINALWEADRQGYPRPLRYAIWAARVSKMTDRQIAAELVTTPEDVAARAAAPDRANYGGVYERHHDYGGEDPR